MNFFTAVTITYTYYKSLNFTCTIQLLDPGLELIMISFITRTPKLFTHYKVI